MVELQMLSSLGALPFLRMAWWSYSRERPPGGVWSGQVRLLGCPPCDGPRGPWLPKTNGCSPCSPARLPAGGLWQAGVSGPGPSEARGVRSAPSSCPCPCLPQASSAGPAPACCPACTCRNSCARGGPAWAPRPKQLRREQQCGVSLRGDRSRRLLERDCAEGKALLAFTPCPELLGRE